jgi:protocatechuate 3,4-dioxygenase beta subunit
LKTSRTKTAALLLLLALTAAHAARAQETAAPVIIQTPAPTQQSAPAAQQATPAPPRTQTQAGANATQKATGASPGDSPASARAAAAPITGRVVGEAGEPIPGVNVYAASRAVGSSMRQPLAAASDDAGNFQFRGLQPGLYQLWANLPAYVTEPDPLTGRPVFVFRPGDTALLRLTKGGVITGAVTDPQGEPLVGLSVRAVRVRDLDGRVPPSPFPASAEDATDDRGVYRIYGLQPGVYVIYGGGAGPAGGFGNFSAYGGDAPTFYPSSTRDTAAEVTVRAGQETAGIDIRYREEQGHRVTGTVELPSGAPAETYVGLTLTFASTGMPAGSAGLNTASAERGFSIEGVADGEYDLQATFGGREGPLSASAPQRVTVKGADVTGLRVALVPLGSAAGTLVIEPAAEAERARAECKAVPAAARRPQETMVTATPERPASSNRVFSRFAAPHDATPDEAGAFTLRALEAGRLHVSVRLFDEALYLRAVEQPGAAALAAPPAPATSARASIAAATRTSSAPVSRETFDVKAGQQFSGLVVRLAEGAASFAGRVALVQGAATQTPAPTRVYLVPQERERAEDPLRFYETAVGAEGAFAFRNVAPGRYLVLARAEAEAGDAATRPAAWDADRRALLRREAEGANTPAELQPCQRTADFTLRFPQSSK